MNDLKALFIPTVVSGVVYWRMVNPWVASLRTKAFKSWVLWWQKDMSASMHPWQSEVMSSLYHAKITGELSAACKDHDVIIIGMLHIPPGMQTLQAIREMYGKPVVMEIDDNILSCPEYNPAAGTYGPNNNVRKITIQQMRESDAMVVSTPYLKEIYSEFNDHIYVVPNAIDFELWGKAQRKRNKGRLTIGWVGGANHNDDLLIIGPAIEYLTAKYPHVEFVFGHGMHPNFRGKKGVRWIQEFVRIDKYPKAVAKMGFDIGVAPLVDNAFNRAKSNLRWLEYSALGIPTVASNVGHFKETIEHGKTGLLCEGAGDFIGHLEMLIKDTAKRKELAKNAKAEVFKNWNIDNVVKTYGTILQEIVKRGQVAKTMPSYKESNFKQEAVCQTEAN